MCEKGVNHARTDEREEEARVRACAWFLAWLVFVRVRVCGWQRERREALKR